MRSFELNQGTFVSGPCLHANAIRVYMNAHEAGHSQRRMNSCRQSDVIIMNFRLISTSVIWYIASIKCYSCTKRMRGSKNVPGYVSYWISLEQARYFCLCDRTIVAVRPSDGSWRYKGCLMLNLLIACMTVALIDMVLIRIGMHEHVKTSHVAWFGEFIVNNSCWMWSACLEQSACLSMFTQC